MEFERQGLVGLFELFDVYSAVPVDYFEYDQTKRIIFLLKEDKYYAHTCSRLGAEVDYQDREIMIFAVDDEEQPNDGDGLFTVKLDDAKWEDVVEQIGTFEHNKDILTQKAAAAAVESRKNRVPKNVEKHIASFLGGRRKTRKSKKNRKQTRRRKN
jgi:hypothetical protein